MQPLHYSSEIEQYHGVFYGPRIGFCLFCLRGRKSDANPVEFCRIVGHSGHGCPVSSQATGLQSPAESAFLAACAAQKRSGMGKTAVFVLACLQQIDSSEKAALSAFRPTGGRLTGPRQAVRTLVVCHTRELAYQASHTGSFGACLFV